MNKYGAKRKEIDGITFDSQAEAQRYLDLKLWLSNQGDIDSLDIHPAWDVVVNGVKVCRYVADFRYTDPDTGETVIEDVKGMKTPVYRLKKKLMAAVHGIEIVEVSV